MFVSRLQPSSISNPTLFSLNDVLNTILLVLHNYNYNDVKDDEMGKEYCTNRCEGECINIIGEKAKRKETIRKVNT
jgi:hypothetical protein